MEDVGGYCGAFEDGVGVQNKGEINIVDKYDGANLTNDNAKYNQVMMLHNMTEIKQSNQSNLLHSNNRRHSNNNITNTNTNNDNHHPNDPDDAKTYHSAFT